MSKWSDTFDFMKKKTKQDKIVETMEKWVNGELTSQDADSELEELGIKLPKPEESNIGG